jgi:hypothetical protein
VCDAIVMLGSGCSQESQNRLSQIAVTWLEGDCRITFAEGNHLRTWEVRGGKVTSKPDKGYYLLLDPGGRQEPVRADAHCPHLHRGDHVASE